jgi:hypothetical protein
VGTYLMCNINSVPTVPTVPTCCILLTWTPPRACADPRKSGLQKSL